MTVINTYKDIYYCAEDGTRLYARDYQVAQEQFADRADDHKDQVINVLCMHGLTRNCRDFEPMIAALSPTSIVRYIVPDQRGRGLSGRCSPEKYTPEVYARDMWTLMDHLGIENFLIIGTSMGGIISLIMCSQDSNRINGICLNDVGPTIDQQGLKLVFNYLGKNIQASGWDEAINNVKRFQTVNFPEFNDQDWRQFAERIYQINDNGSLSLAYDPAISIPIKAAVENGDSADLWPFFKTTSGVDLLIIRGEFSQLLSQTTVNLMESEHPRAQSIEIKNRGHAPLLDEPEAISAIEAWIAAAAQAPTV